MKNKKNLKCFICKEIIENEPLSEIKRVMLPTKERGYVHIKHYGVKNLKYETN